MLHTEVKRSKRHLAALTIHDRESSSLSRRRFSQQNYRATDSCISGISLPIALRARLRKKSPQPSRGLLSNRCMAHVSVPEDGARFGSCWPPVLRPAFMMQRIWLEEPDCLRVGVLRKRACALACAMRVDGGDGIGWMELAPARQG